MHASDAALRSIEEALDILIETETLYENYLSLRPAIFDPDGLGSFIFLHFLLHILH